MADNLTNDLWKWILKQYWKTENAQKFRQKWAEEFDETGSICNAPKSGRLVSVTTKENEMLVSQAFTKSPPKSK